MLIQIYNLWFRNFVSFGSHTCSLNLFYLFKFEWWQNWLLYCVLLYLWFIFIDLANYMHLSARNWWYLVYRFKWVWSTTSLPFLPFFINILNFEQVWLLITQVLLKYTWFSPINFLKVHIITPLYVLMFFVDVRLRARNIIY